MKNVDSIRKVSVWIFFTPVIVINFCLFISINYEFYENTIFMIDRQGIASFTIPYIDGGVSISRVTRYFPAYLAFKPGMIITAILLIKYWRTNNILSRNISNEKSKNYYFLYFGVTSAVFLIIHSIFLGIKFEYDLYKLFRRIVLLCFIIFEVVAQTLLVIYLYKIKDKISDIINKKILTLKIILVGSLIIVAIGSIPYIATPGHTAFKHSLEWNFFIGILIFYLLTYLFWKKKPT